MYKYYEKNGYHIMYYDFDSMSDFLQYLKNQPINTNVFGPSTLVSHQSSYSWYKTYNFDEAIELATYGSREEFDRFYKLKIQLEKFIKLDIKKNIQSNDYVGYTPDVKAYLEGNPLSMFNKIRPQRKRIDIYFNSANLVGVSTSQIYNRGVITLCLVEMLEALGFNVSLNVFAMSEKNKQIHYAKFTFKSENEHLNSQKLFFPMCHPSWFRRLIFNLREKTPDISEDWLLGYGSTCGVELIRSIIDLKENDIVICKPDEMGVKGVDLIIDANAMFKYIDNETKINGFELLNR